MSEQNRPVPPVKSDNVPGKQVVFIDDHESALVTYVKRKTGKTGRTIAASCLIANIIIAAIPFIWAFIIDMRSQPGGGDDYLDLFGGFLEMIFFCGFIFAAVILMVVFACIGLAFGIDGLTSSRTTAEKIRSWVYIVLHGLTVGIPAVFFLFVQMT
ncbi:MAG: hypothetical protein AAF456_10585 [Planctomycetota bacterium]